MDWGNILKESKPGTNVEIREHLANERTLLAWVRTGIGLISVGFVVERAGALASSASPGSASVSSEVFGVALVALGCVALLLGAFQFFRSRRMISEGVFAPRAAPYMILVVGSFVLALSFVVYALVT